ncbi:MAG: aspartate kinase, partial [Nannocystaceae bacterium]
MLVVQKYGGSSVRDLERIRAVAERCAQRRSRGDDLVVVVSAMAGQTDQLISMANELVTTARGESDGEWVPSARSGDDAHERELSQLMSTGEKVSAALLSMALNEAGCPATSLV